MIGFIERVAQKVATDVTRRCVVDAVRQHLESEGFKATVLAVAQSAIRSHPAFTFVRAMQRRYLEKRTGLTPRQAWEHARINLADFLKGERIKFGDDRYDWSEDGARGLVDADLEYWEAA